MTVDDLSLRDTLRRLTNGFQVSQAIHVAASLRIADLLSNGPRSVEDLAATTGTTATALTRLLRALASIGIFAEGALLAVILAANLPMRGIVFDLPDVLTGASAVLQRAGVTDRCQLVAGSFFETIPPGADAYIVKSIIHDWDDAAALAILRCCRIAIPDTGRLLLVEHALKPVNEPDPARFSDLNMLVMLGGQEREPDEFERLCAGAGFRLTAIVPTASTHSVIEARPV